MTVFDKLRESPVQAIAYGQKFAPVKGTAVEAGQIFRQDRGTPFYRAGVPVKVVPQFRATTLFSPISTNAVLPTINITPTQISYPTKVR